MIGLFYESASQIFQLVVFFSCLYSVNSRTYTPIEYAPVIVIGVETKQYAELGASLDLFQKDLANESWHSTIELINTTSATELHQIISDLYDMYRMHGVVLVGKFPYSSGGDSHLSTPFNSGTGFIPLPAKPRFWISRIDASSLAEELSEPEQANNENALIKNYFSKNHLLRRYQEYPQGTEKKMHYIYSVFKGSDYLFMSTELTPGNSVVTSVKNSSELFSSMADNDAFYCMIIAHGSCRSVRLTKDEASVSAIFHQSRSNSRAIVLNSCSTHCDTVGNPASAFLFAPNSRTLATLASRKDLSAMSYIESMRPFPEVDTLGQLALHDSLISLKSILNTTFWAMVVEILFNRIDPCEGCFCGDLFAFASESRLFNSILAVLFVHATYRNLQAPDNVLLGDGTLPLP